MAASADSTNACSRTSEGTAANRTIRRQRPARRDSRGDGGADGEITLRGPEAFVGYLHPSDNKGAFDANGFFRMGDLGQTVHGDWLVITGRKKDIIRSGENISPKEVEDILPNHPSVADVAIVAMPSAATGEKGCAFVVPRQGQAAPDLSALAGGGWKRDIAVVLAQGRRAARSPGEPR